MVKMTMTCTQVEILDIWSLILLLIDTVLPAYIVELLFKQILRTRVLQEGLFHPLKYLYQVLGLPQIQFLC